MPFYFACKHFEVALKVSIIKAMKWYYTTQIDSNQATITGDELNHLSNVMRAKVGDRVVCFNGQGTWAECQIVSLTKSICTLKPQNQNQTQPPKTKLTLAAALIKGDRQDTMIRQATELGITDLVLLETDRSEVKITSSKPDKIQKQLIACCKQCHSATLPSITLSTLKSYCNCLSDELVLVGSFNATQTLTDLNPNLITSKNTTILVGPEGGFSPAEEELFSAKNFQKVSLGKNVLRADTACAMLVSYAKCIKNI